MSLRVFCVTRSHENSFYLPVSNPLDFSAAIVVHCALYRDADLVVVAVVDAMPLDCDLDASDALAHSNLYRIEWTQK